MVKLRHIAMAVIFVAGCKAETADPLKAATLVPDIESVEALALASNGTGQPALWLGTNGDTKVYVFGTIHNLRGGKAWMTDTIKSAFNDAQTLILETDVFSEDALKAMEDYRLREGELPAEESLFTHLDTGDAYRLKNLLKNLGEEPDSFSHLQPWLAALRVSQLRKEKAGFDSSVDTVLEQKAQASGKTIAYLEKVSEQMQLFDDASFAAQLSNLNQVTQNMDLSFRHMDLIANEWNDGDVAGLGYLVANPDFGYDHDSYQTILRDRNRKWSGKIETLLDKPGTHFVAVGAAHLAGPDSLIKMLDDKKSIMERVQ